MTVRVRQSQRWFARASHSGQESASIINSASELFVMEINFNDQHCFEAIILKIQDMIETIPERIITNPKHQKTLVNILLSSLKKSTD